MSLPLPDISPNTPPQFHDTRRVCFVLPGLEAGGAERVMIKLMTALDRSLFTPSLIVVNGSGPYRDLIPPEIDFADLRARNMAAGVHPLLQALKVRKPYIIVSTMAPMNFIVLGLKPRLPPTTRFVVREAITPGFVLNGTGFLKRIVSPILWRRLYPRADLVLSPAARVFDEFECHLGLHFRSCAVLPNPVDVHGLRDKAADNVPPLFTPQTRTKFVCAGRLHRQKGFDRLIDGMATLGGDEDWELVIMGEGPERADLESRIAAHGLQERIRLPGLQSNPWATMAQADCLLLPSRWEGLPNVVLESLAVGTPVIAMAEAGGIHEIAKDTAQNAVHIATDMNDFMQAVSNRLARPAGKRPHLLPSLLPARFHQAEINARFSELLHTLSPIPLAEDSHLRRKHG